MRTLHAILRHGGQHHNAVLIRDDMIAEVGEVGQDVNFQRAVPEYGGGVPGRHRPKIG